MASDEPVSTSHPCANNAPFPRVYNIRVLFHYPDGFLGGGGGGGGGGGFRCLSYFD